MAAKKTFTWKLARLFEMHRRPRRGRKPVTKSPAAESLEDRLLLAGVVVDASTFDFSLFAANIAEQAGVGNPAGLQAEGYSYAISQRDESDPFGTFQSASGSAGLARNPWDNGGVGLAASALRDQESASLTKTITAASVMRVWQEQTASADELSDRLDDPILNYLPASWGNNASNQFLGLNVSIRDLLTHTSGLWGANANATPPIAGTASGIPGSLTNNGYVYSDLQQITQSTVVYAKTPRYWTINYAYFRVALPYMWANDLDSGLDPGETGFRDQLEAADNGQPIDIDFLPAGVWDQIQADFGFDATDLDEDNMLQIGPDQLTASAYKTYVIQYILPSNISNPQTRTNGNFFTLLYQFPAPNGVAGFNTGDQTLLVGSRGWNLSARDIERFLSALRYDDNVLTQPTRDLMNAEFLGWQPGGNYVGDLGQYYGHNGINFNAQIPGAPPNTNAARNNTAAVTFPGGVQGVLYTNSQLGPQFGAAFDPAGNQNPREVALVDAYDNAWTHVVYAGDGGFGAFADDTFVLRQVAGTNDWIELLHDTTTVMQRRIDTIQYLQINGLGGDDTLTIQSLPDNFAFQIVFNGAGANDTINVNTTSDGGLLDIDFNGGSGADVATTSGLIVGSTIDFSFNGGSGDDTATIDDLPSGGEFTFSGAAGNDQVNVVGTVPGSIVTLHGGANDDTVILGTTGNLDHVQTTFLFVGGSGSDFLHINDKNNTSFDPTRNGYDQEYIVRLNRVNRSGIGVVGQFSQLEDVTLDASDGKSLIRVLSTTSFTDLQLNANKGDDRVVLGSGNASTQLNSLTRVAVGDGDDTLVIDDRFSQFSEEKYVFHREYFTASSILLVEWGDTSPPESIRLRQSQVGTETNIRNLLSGVRLDVEGNAGDDRIYVHKTEAGSNLFVGGGERDDTIVLGQESQDVDPIQGVVRAYGGSGTDLLVVQDAANTDADGRNYRVLGRTIDVIGSPFGKLIVPGNAGMETVEIRGGVRNDLFDVRTWQQSAALHVHGNLGDDELRVASTTHTLASIVGDLEYFADPPLLSGTPSPNFDTVILHDDQRVGSPDYDIDVGPDLEADLVTTGFDFTHYGVEELTLNANDTGNDVDVFGQASILHKADYILNVGGGKDRIFVQAPVSATVFGNGGTGNDLLAILGTAGDDEATVLGDRVDLRPVGVITTTSVVRNDDILVMQVDSEAGNDVLIVQGEAGLQESIRVASLGIPAAGRIFATPFRRVDFVDTEDVNVRGNAGDGDTLAFVGTNQADTFSINPVGAGTTFQPFVHLTQSGGINLLKLRDATDVGTPVIRGEAGSDIFRVTMFPGGSGYPVRSMQLEAGEDAEDTDVDQLIINYDNTIFNVIGPATNPNNGTIRFDDGSNILGIVFRDFEDLAGDVF